MKSWNAPRVRQAFLEFFRERGHTIVPSSSLLPPDPTLLFTNAGMNQFKPYFLREVDPPFPRAATVQKCIRAGGKHNDLDNVGFTRRHHTFFEMLGNFSFGDYFKKEAIRFAWDLLTEVYGLDPDRLYATVYEEDDEAYAIWRDEIGLPEDRILRFGARDNFWEMGEVGPCGPSSEILYDLGEDADPSQKTPYDEGERFLELWNLVFMQYNRLPDGSLEELPAKNIDTGMGLERLLAVLQGELSNYHTDLFLPIMEEVARITGVPYDRGEAGAPHRVIADHVRALTFAIADGIYPSNFGRGYVLRRILRRAYRFGQRIGVEEPLLYRLVPVVVDLMGEAYPELRERKVTVQQVIRQEEERFIRTIARHWVFLEEALKKAAASEHRRLPGETFFRLYDTYGLPLDLIEERAGEVGVQLDWDGFEAAMQAQRERARARSAFQMELPEWRFVDETYTGSQFVGYDTLHHSTRLAKLGMLGETVFLVLKETPFYPEGGGQVGDRGWIEGEGWRVEVQDTRRVGMDIVHTGRLTQGTLPENPEMVQAYVDPQHREGVRRAHTGTHLLHAALRDILGGHARQHGSLVAPDRIRFDFAHPTAVSAEELEAIERTVNAHIRANLPVHVSWMRYREALASGAMALFEEKYGDEVRVISIGEVSRELCGGTHASATGDLGCFKILKEESVAAGIRRIEAYVGERALTYVREHLNRLHRTAHLLKCDITQIEERASHLLQTHHSLEKQFRRLLDRYTALLSRDLSDRARQVDGHHVLITAVEDLDPEGVRRLADGLLSRLDPAVLVLAAPRPEGGVFLHARVSKSLKDRYHAGDLIRSLARELGGGGGGSPFKAEGGGRSAEHLDQALRALEAQLTG